MKKIFLLLMLIVLIISCKKNDNISKNEQNTKFKFNEVINNKSDKYINEIYLVNEDPFKLQFISLNDNGKCRVVTNKCEGYDSHLVNYKIFTNIIEIYTENSIFLELEKSNNELKIIYGADSIACGNYANGAKLTKVNTKIYKTNQNNINFYYANVFSPSQAGVIRKLNKDEKVIYISTVVNKNNEKLENEIDGKKGIWYSIISEKNEWGFCFSEYLDLVNE